MRKITILIIVILCTTSVNLELIELNEDNWDVMLKGEWMVKFFAPWCPACKSIGPIWKRFASIAEKSNYNVAQIDVTKSPSLSGRFLVTALPTIYHVKDGEFRLYRGSRDTEALTAFMKQKEWQNVSPISSWKNPNSIHMSILSYFFKLSHLLKDFNVRLQEDYGLPTWASYALLATGTIFVGAASGLALVCVVDFLYPAKKTRRQSFCTSDEKSCNAVDDEIVDDTSNGNEDEDENSSKGLLDGKKKSLRESDNLKNKKKES